MSKRVKPLRVLQHETVVEVTYQKRQVIGYAFGKDPQSGTIFVCLPKDQLVEAGLECKGPCINKGFDPKLVKILKDMGVVEKEPKNKRVDVDIAKIDEEED